MRKMNGLAVLTDALKLRSLQLLALKSPLDVETVVQFCPESVENSTSKIWVLPLRLIHLATLKASVCVPPTLNQSNCGLVR